MAAGALICVLLAAFFNAAWTALSKAALQDIQADVFTLAMRFGTALFLIPFFLWKLDTGFPWTFWVWLALAGFMETVAIVIQSVGVRRDFYGTYSLGNLAPLFVLMMAPGMLGESASAVLVAGVLLIVGGAFVFVRAGFSWYGIGAAVFFALYNMCSKIGIDQGDPFFFSFPAVMLGVVLYAPWVIWVKPPKEKVCFRRKTVLLLTATAFMSFLATILFFVAISLGDVTRVSSLVRSNLIFGFVLSYFLLHEREHWRRKLAGGCLIALGTVLVGIAQ